MVEAAGRPAANTVPLQSLTVVPVLPLTLQDKVIGHDDAPLAIEQELGITLKYARLGVTQLPLIIFCPAGHTQAVPAALITVPLLHDVNVQAPDAVVPSGLHKCVTVPYGTL